MAALALTSGCAMFGDGQPKALKIDATAKSSTSSQEPQPQK